MGTRGLILTAEAGVVPIKWIGKEEIRERRGLRRRTEGGIHLARSIWSANEGIQRLSDSTTIGHRLFFSSPNEHSSGGTFSVIVTTIEFDGL